jgi:flavin reductase (DIM6/NTAB) family NADH-FMN oxidoreductase RutF
MGTYTLRPDERPVPEVFRLLTSVVAPRPIALVSTVSDDGTPNLAPFSFFNAFGANPPMVGFSPSRRVRDGTTKDTYHNLKATEQCVVNVVPSRLVDQANLASAEFGPDVDEWPRTGLTPVPSELVTPARVAESPVQMECRLFKLVPLGDGPGAGNLFLCEVVRFHLDEAVLTSFPNPATPDAPLKVDLDGLDLVGRGGAFRYSRTAGPGPAAFSLPKPTGGDVIGWDRLPAALRESTLYTASEVARLATCPALPTPDDLDTFAAAHQPTPGTEDTATRLLAADQPVAAFQTALHLYATNTASALTLLHHAISAAIAANDLDFALPAALLTAQLQS